MLSKKPLTPEKQLLKLIEDPVAKDTVSLAALKHHGLSFFSIPAWIARVAYLNGRFLKWLKDSKPRRIDSKAINIILFGFVCFLGVSFIITISVSILNQKKIPELTLQASSAIKQLEGFGEKTARGKSVAYYLEKVSARDIFKMGPKKTETALVPEKTGGSLAKILEATAHLKLVGISWSSDPDAMIEDTKALKTFFVKRGQMIDNVKVQAIFKDKVVLSYAGEEIELK